MDSTDTLRQSSNRELLLRTSCYALAYIFAVHFVYVRYINPTFAYAFYEYLPFSTGALLSTYFVTWLPILAFRSSDHPAQAAVALIYALVFVPIQLSLIFQVDSPYYRLLWVQSLLAVSMMVLFVAAKGRRRRPPLVRPQFRIMDGLIVAISIATASMLFWVNRGHLRLVSFGDVYELRAESTATVGQGAIYAYLTSWLIYCFVSYLLARGLVHRKWSLLVLGILCSVLEYAAAGHKTTILMLPLTLGLYWLWGSGGRFLSRFLLAATVVMVCMVFLLPDTGIAVWAKSIFLIRLMGSSGWLLSKYLEFFPDAGLTYYTHISPVNALVGGYPYGSLSLGQIIGLEYSGTIEANHNASFWATDGIAALGPIGILVITPAVALLLVTINRLMASFDSKFVVLWMCGFFMALLNVPLSTALLSGGGLIILAQAWWLSRSYKLTRPALSPLPVLSELNHR